MKKLIYLILILLFSNNCFSQWELKDTIEFQARDQLPNFFNRINNTHSVNIGFIGGSITAANGWRSKITNWIKNNYNLDNIYTYNAAIGGTNSKYGVFRIEKQLLNIAEFDLVFVEFAVNDGGAISSDVEKSMEGIVRKIWKRNPYTDICFVYTVNTNSLANSENGKMNLSATKHDSIASYYGIPSIYWTEQVYNMIKADTVVWYDGVENATTYQNNLGQYVFTSDNTHPTDFGHEVYTSILAKCIDKMKNSVYNRSHSLKTAIFPDNYENASMLSGKEPNNHGFTTIDSTGEISYLNNFINSTTPLLVSPDTLSNYSFSFYGNQLGFNIIIGPTGGYYIVEVDSIKNKYKAFDGYCSYYRPSPIFLKTAETKEHFVRIYPSTDSLTLADKRNILNTDSRKQDLDNNPSKYNKNELIFSDIFLDGYLTNYSYDTIAACSGDTVYWQGKKLTKDGTYYLSNTLSNGFDSIIDLSLTFNPAYNQNEEISICAGELPYTFHDTIFQAGTNSGTYIFNRQTINGCDSILSLSLTVNPSYFLEFTNTITVRDSIEWEGSFYKSFGEYYNNLHTINGCDSILKLNLFTSKPLDILENQLSNIVVYPNPCNDFITISSRNVTNKQSLRIINTFGTIVYDATLSYGDELQIRTSDYPKGMYFIIYDGKVMKFIKE